MKTAIYHGPGDMRIEERPNPEAGCNEVVVKVKACTICAIHDLDAWQRMVPTVLGKAIGHEYVGEVIKVGSNVNLVKKGDRLFTFNPYIPCYRCSYCLQGEY